MKLYHHPISTYSQKVLIALYEKDLDFEREIVQLMDPEKRAVYREVYPMGKIPLLVDGEHRVPESSIIIEYIDRMGERRLIKGDADQQRKIRFKDRMFDLYLNEAVVTLLFQGMKPEEQRDAERIENAWHRIKTMYMFMENEFGGQDYANGDEFLMADCAAAPALLYAQKVAPFSEHKNIVAYWERLKSRPSVARTINEAAPYIEAMEKQAAA
ncbi:MAG: glutathione S-transferase family protein [Gammaproteobacteria bacterium]|nr:glutathione S-transferase family protein [Gammaproteobacteria bacterium]